MSLTKTVQNGPENASLTKEQQIEALRKNLTGADLEIICRDHKIGRATYYRIIKDFDLGNPVMLAIVQAAEANKKKADERARLGAAALKKLV